MPLRHPKSYTHNMPTKEDMDTTPDTKENGRNLRMFLIIMTVFIIVFVIIIAIIVINFDGLVFSNDVEPPTPITNERLANS